MNILKRINSLLFNSKISIVFLCLFLFYSALFSQTQNIYRRHFIIALDNSENFRSIYFNNTGDVQKALEELFSNNDPKWGGDLKNLWNKDIGSFDLFSPGKDEISFCLFNYTNLNSNLRYGSIKEFCNTYFRDNNIRWSELKSTKTLSDYFTVIFSSQSHSSVNLSKFLYPLVLSNIEITTLAEEYILIVISPNYIQPVNDDDFKSLSNILANSGKTLTDSIKLQFNKFNSLYSIEKYYFDAKQGSGTNSQRIISGYKVTPKNVLPGSVATAVTLNQDITFKQTTYKGDTYEISNFQLNFPNNIFLKPTELTLKITEQENSTLLFNDEILRITNVNNWESDYSEISKVLNYKNGVYSLNGLKVLLPDLDSEKKPLKLELIIKTKVTDGIINPLNFVYYSNTEVPESNIILFSYDKPILYGIIILIIVIILVFVLIYYGKPLALKFNIDGYLDSYEIIDYKNLGKLLTPYNAWNPEIHSVDFLIVNGELKYKNSGYLLNWNTTIHIRLQDFTIPNGFELFLKYNNDDLKEFGKGHTMSIKRKRGKNFSFIIGIRQNNITRQIIDPELVKFTIEGVVRDSKLIVKTDLRENLEYKFHIGKDLGDVWIGFDPGTTGSCVAVGSSTENIILAEDRPNNRIFTSVLAFNREADFVPNGSDIPKSIYTYGERSRVLGRRVNEWRSFQSFKKLLGYKTSFDINFSNGNILKVNGKKLAGLLVEGLYDDLHKFINRPGFDNREYLSKGNFKPLRAVVAIPNNFTISKTQDMVDCINNFSRFKEVRYVYEAEAVLFFYLSNYSKFNIGEEKLNSETVLVFDMGGATINATVVNVNKTLINKRPKYEIDLLGKIGYGIGGDTIDYCIAKFILSFTKEFPQFGSIDLFERQVPLAELAFQIKKEIIANFHKSNSYLITAFNLENFINRALGISISINEDSSEMYKYFVKVSGKYKLFEHPLFSKIIYNNVKDAVNEVIELSENIQIQKIIFSGRSTLFPMVKETVEKQLSSNNSNIKSIPLNLEESKTAVAKGACWYGINKNSVRLNNLKTNASFGFKKTQSADKSDVKFYELVEMGCNFDISNNGIDSFTGIKEYVDDFAFDGSKVNFYQVMGKNANKILSEDQKHKFSKIATINLAQISSKIGMKVSENDEVECVVVLKSNPNRPLKEKGVVADQEIDEANEEHYTWFVK